MHTQQKLFEEMIAEVKKDSHKIRLTDTFLSTSAAKMPSAHITPPPAKSANWRDHVMQIIRRRYSSPG